MIRIHALNQEANISTRDCILKKLEGMFLCQSRQEIAYFQNLKYLNKTDLFFFNDLENVLNTCLIDLRMLFHILFFKKVQEKLLRKLL